MKTTLFTPTNSVKNEIQAYTTLKGNASVIVLKYPLEDFELKYGAIHWLTDDIGVFECGILVAYNEDNDTWEIDEDHKIFHNIEEEE